MNNNNYIITSDKLEKVKEIKKSKFWKVYEGRWNKHNTVAIKYFQMGEFGERTQQYFEQELSKMVMMRHPNVVQFLGYNNSPMYLVMQYLPKTLQEHLKSQKYLSWEYKKDLSKQVVQGLQYIHESDIIHKDLNSNNILMDNEDVLKISDFGLLEIKQEAKTSSTNKQVERIK